MAESLQKLPFHTVSDENLASRVQEGCQDSFAELVERLQPRLLFLLRRRLGHHSDAEDVAQKTLLRAYEKIHLYDANKKFSPWLFTIAIRLAADHHRQQKKHNSPNNETAPEVEDLQPSPEQHAIAREQSNDLWTLAEKALPPNQWTALWLLYGEGQTVREISQTLGQSNVSTRVMLYRARKKLTPHLAKYLEADLSETNDLSRDTTTQPTLQVARAES